MHRIGRLLKADAIRRCPVDQGDLRRSIDYRVEGNKVILFATDDNAEAMEYGTPPSPLSAAEKESLVGWSERHKANANSIIAYVKKHGIKVGTPTAPLHITSYGRDSYRPFLRPAIYLNLEEIKRIIQKG